MRASIFVGLSALAVAMFVSAGLVQASEDGKPPANADISLAKGMTDDRFERRRTAREALEDHFRQVEQNPAELDAMGEFYQQAYKLISSPAARKAFSLDGEPEAMTKLYGDYKNPRNRQPFGLGRRLMLARRLVEAGVRFVTVSYNGSDGCNFPTLD